MFGRLRRRESSICTRPTSATVQVGKASAIEDAVALLQDGRGRHFDPELVELFLDSMAEVLDIRSRFRDI